MSKVTQGGQSAAADPVPVALLVAAFAMASMAGVRGSNSNHHVLRIQQYVKALAQQLANRSEFTAILTPAYIDLLFQLAPLHDMGTIGIPDRILLKPGALTPEEFEIMKTHTSLALGVIEQFESSTGVAPELLQTLKELAYSHHERWDGSGYPQGLQGTQIPLAARLLAIVDVYDVLTSNHVYGAGIRHDQAVATIFQGRASHFDPDLVDVFIEMQGEFAAIAARHVESDLERQHKIEYMANAIAEQAH